MRHALLLLSIPLPPGYRSADVLAFHGRDAQGVAERVD
jgi:DNA-3-methyladenine glycosylase II